MEDAIRKGFLQLDDEMSHEDSLKNDLAGSTGIAVILRNNRVYCVSNVP